MATDRALQEVAEGGAMGHLGVRWDEEGFKHTLTLSNTARTKRSLTGDTDSKKL